MAAQTLTIDGRQISAEAGASVLQAATEAGIHIPTLCHLDGIYDLGACRICLAEIKGSPKLHPACTTLVREGMEISTDSERLRRYRRMTIELLLAERNHVCSTCVSNGHCELQDLAADHGIDHVRYPYRFPRWGVDASHRRFGMDHNRCVLCARCVRVCWHVEAAGTLNIAGRGSKASIITDLSDAWGDSETCTSCGKCVSACPTGALFNKGATAAEMQHDRTRLEYIINARDKHQWSV